MAKQRKLLPAHRREAVDDSVLIRSAETLGRMIGSLHRQLDSARKRFTGPADEIAKGIPVRGNGHSGGNTTAAEVMRAKPQRRARAASTSRASSPSTKSQKSQSAAERKSKRAPKSARAMKKK